ncbi:MAG TPA: hypothetical protein PKY29_04510 [Ferruginibacter sp.]|nr:hypothetical protein [Ferruginibacter sp.]HRQ20551.1 hypothetical protein [Ferruginibacter sp.]
MKRHVSVTIPVKPYIRAFIIHELGTPYIKVTQGSHSMVDKLYDLLERDTNERKSERQCRYGSEIKLFIPFRTFNRRGHCLNHTNIARFNKFVELMIKERFFYRMNTLIDVLPNFSTNLTVVRNELGIDIESWSDDSMQKEYYRYRKKKNLPLLYKNTFAPTVL